MRVLYLAAIAAVAVVLFVACGGNGSDPDSSAPLPTETGSDRQVLDLGLSSESYGDGTHRVLLHGHGARDLYQIAGTLNYDPALYEIVLVEAGGGLGNPEQSYFIDNRDVPGSLDFAYTRRWHGPGVDGDPLLLSVKVRPLGAFELSDFSIDTSADALRLRDSQKQDLRCLVNGEEAGNE